MSFFFNDTATTEIYTLSLHDALPICLRERGEEHPAGLRRTQPLGDVCTTADQDDRNQGGSVALRSRSEEHTSELQSRQYLVCRLLLENKKNIRLPSCPAQKHPECGLV